MTSEPEIRLHDTAAALAADVAERLLVVLRDTQSTGRTPHVVLTGGTIATVIHEAVAAGAEASGVDWSKVEFWWGDERFVAPDSPDRNSGQARASLLDHLDGLGLDPGRVHEIASTADAGSVEEAAASYAAEVRAADAGEFDVVMLGVGPDGHVASLFPGFPQVEVDDEIAVGVTGSPKPPPERVSLTFPPLNRSRAVWFVVSGEEKAGAVARALSPTGTLAETPARGANGLRETVWFLDSDSASQLS